MADFFDGLVVVAPMGGRELCHHGCVQEDDRIDSHKPLVGAVRESEMVMGGRDGVCNRCGDKVKKISG